MRVVALSSFAVVAFVACQCERPPAAAPASAAPPGRPAGCAIVFRVTVEPAGAQRNLSVSIENTTAGPITLDLPDRCPNGIVDLEGLGAGYDYYDTCTKGACARVGTLRHFALAPQEKRVIADTTVDLEKGGGCRRPLGPGHYMVRAVVPAGVSGCADETSIDIAPPR